MKRKKCREEVEVFVGRVMEGERRETRRLGSARREFCTWAALDVSGLAG